ncbi:hypothetical protein [Allofournierella sp. CML151]|uniref:hypothetical protein n=1 Tax=Allofournierella sp. CML151 TaxID=2998082 RepID=UPI0022EB214A|nr:hypothetical protein [Fournierella sp. CML151]
MKRFSLSFERLAICNERESGALAYPSIVLTGLFSIMGSVKNKAAALRADAPWRKKG